MCGFMTEPAHILPETARSGACGQLCIGEVALSQLAEQFGSLLTFYEVATRAPAVAANRHGLVSYPGETASVSTAKAFATGELLRLLASEGLGVDCVSEGELALARAAGVSAERLVLHGNNKSEEELRFALELGVGRIVVDNHDELERLAAIARSTGKTVSILLRLNPGVEPHDTHAYRRTGQLDSKFGLPIVTGDAEAAVARCLSTPELALLGFHVHIGSQLFDLIPYQRAIEQVFAFAGELSRRFAFSLREFSPGGGFGIPYTTEDPVLDLAEATAQVSRWVAEAASMAGLPLPRLVLEPGRSLVGRAGMALYRVGSVKRLPGIRTYVAVDGGMADNIRPALYGARYLALPVIERADRRRERVTLVGKYCESGDVLVRDAVLPEPVPGDLVAIPVAGAYCLAMASNYNLARRPVVVALEAGRVELWQRRETIADLLAREAGIEGARYR